MWRALVLASVLVLALLGAAVPAGGKVQVGVVVEASTEVEVGVPFSLRLVPLACDDCPTEADITSWTLQVVTDEGRVVWEGGVSAQLTLEGIVLGADDMQVGAATWLRVMVPTGSVAGLIPEVENEGELPEFLSVGRIAVLGSASAGNMTALMVVVGVMLVAMVAGLLMRRSGRSGPQSHGLSGEAAQSR